MVIDIAMSSKVFAANFVKIQPQHVRGNIRGEVPIFEHKVAVQLRIVRDQLRQKRAQMAFGDTCSQRLRGHWLLHGGRCVSVSGLDGGKDCCHVLAGSVLRRIGTVAVHAVDFIAVQIDFHLILITLGTFDKGGPTPVCMHKGPDSVFPEVGFPTRQNVGLKQISP